MARGRLVIGNRRYSSWSMRGWLAVRLAGLDVEEVVIPLAGGITDAVRAATPSGTVPYLEHDGARIWESIAICEYCAEINPALWPAERVARAHARAISAEMHAGFRALRQAMPMNVCRQFPGAGITPESAADIARVEQIFTHTRKTFGGGGDYLFGAHITLADVMFLPVVSRFTSYLPKINAISSAYCMAARAHPLVSEWYAQAALEPDAWILTKYETPQV